MKHLPRHLAPILLVLTTTAAIPLQAQTTVTFNNRTAFNAAVTNTNTITYEGGGYTFTGGIASQGQGPYDDGDGNPNTFKFANGDATGTLFGTPLTLRGITYTAGTGRSLEIIDGFNLGSPNNTLLTTYGPNTSSVGEAFTLTLSTHPTAFGFDFKDSSDLSSAPVNLGSYQVYLNDPNRTGTPAAVLNASAPQGTLFFAGFVSDTPINTITVAVLAGGDPTIDNLTTATNNLSAVVPEPGSLALAGLGALLLGAGVVRRRFALRPAAGA